MIENASRNCVTQITQSCPCFMLVTDPFIFGRVAAKKISCTAFAKEVIIVYNSRKQRKIMQASEINIMRRSSKLSVTKKYFKK